MFRRLAVPARLTTADRQWLVVLHPGAAVADAFQRLRAALHARVQSAPVSYASEPRLVLHAFTGMASDDEVLSAVRDWATRVAPLHVALSQVVVSSTERTVVLGVRKTLELFAAQDRLIELSRPAVDTDETQGPVASPCLVPLLYGDTLSDVTWERIMRVASSITAPRACCIVDRVDVVRLDDAAETRLATLRLTA